MVNSARTGCFCLQWEEVAGFKGRGVDLAGLIHKPHSLLQVPSNHLVRGPRPTCAVIKSLLLTRGRGEQSMLLPGHGQHQTA